MNGNKLSRCKRMVNSLSFRTLEIKTISISEALSPVECTNTNPSQQFYIGQSQCIQERRLGGEEENYFWGSCHQDSILWHRKLALSYSNPSWYSSRPAKKSRISLVSRLQPSLNESRCIFSFVLRPYLNGRIACFSFRGNTTCWCLIHRIWSSYLMDFTPALWCRCFAGLSFCVWLMDTDNDTCSCYPRTMNCWRLSDKPFLRFAWNWHWSFGLSSSPCPRWCFRTMRCEYIIISWGLFRRQ